MDGTNFQVVAGILSTTIFTLSNIPMLTKAAKTHDLKSYSGINLVLGNIGNLIHWVYIVYLPFGPIWFLHSFYTISSVFMLLWYFRYEGGAWVTSWPGWRLAGKFGWSLLGRIPLPTGKRGKQLSATGGNYGPAVAC